MKTAVQASYWSHLYCISVNNSSWLFSFHYWTIKQPWSPFQFGCELEGRPGLGPRVNALHIAHTNLHVGLWHSLAVETGSLPARWLLNAKVRHSHSAGVWERRHCLNCSLCWVLLYQQLESVKWNFFFLIVLVSEISHTAFSSTFISCVGCTHCVRGKITWFQIWGLCLCASLSDLFAPCSESTAWPQRVKFPWRGRDAEQTASDFAPSYLGLERLTKTNSSGLMIRGETGTYAAACIKHREGSPPPQVARSSFYKSSDLSLDSCLPKLIRYMCVNTHV